MTKIKVWNPMAPFWSDWNNMKGWPFSEDWDVSFEENELDMYEKDGYVIVKVKCAGLKPEDIEVTLEDKVLTIKGETKEETEEEEKKKKYYRKEIRMRSFARSVTLPSEVKVDQITSEFKNGILKLIMPKSEEAKPKQVKIDVK